MLRDDVGNEVGWFLFLLPSAACFCGPPVLSSLPGKELWLLDLHYRMKMPEDTSDKSGVKFGFVFF